MAYLKQNLAPTRLRELFLQISEDQGWFSSGIEIEDESSTLYASPLTVLKQIEALFGPPPWVFLEPTDIPAHALDSAESNGRKLTRDMYESIYKAMRGSTINYASLPKAPQFTTDQDPQKSIYLWVPGTDPAVKDPLEVFESIRSLSQQTKGGDVMFMYKKPINSEAQHLMPNDQVELWVQRKGSAPDRFATLVVTSILKTAKASTATMYGQVMNFIG